MDSTFEGEDLAQWDTPLEDRQQYARELLAEGFSREEVAQLYGDDALPALKSKQEAL